MKKVRKDLKYLVYREKLFKERANLKCIFLDRSEAFHESGPGVYWDQHRSRLLPAANWEKVENDDASSFPHQTQIKAGKERKQR